MTFRWNDFTENKPKKPVAGIKFEAHFVHNIVKYLSLNMLCYLCSIVNKILTQVIWNSFSFDFIQI